MADDGSAAMAQVRPIGDAIDTSDIHRNSVKVVRPLKPTPDVINR